MFLLGNLFQLFQLVPMTGKQEENTFILFQDPDGFQHRLHILGGAHIPQIGYQEPVPGQLPEGVGL